MVFYVYGHIWFVVNYMLLLGDADLSELRKPIGTRAHCMYQVFVVLNMVIAIISDAYAETEQKNVL